MQYVIEGGNKLFGTVEVCGSKNSVLPLLAASVLTDCDVTFTNCPQITDVFNMIEAVRSTGKKVTFLGDVITVSGTASEFSVTKKASLLRASVLLAGSLFGRLGKAELPLPGGCNIGARPIDVHVDGLRSLGANVTCDDSLKLDGKAKGGEHFLRVASVGATENLLLASVLADGETHLHNCAVEPEVVALENFLTKLGAKIDGIGTSDVTVTGVRSLGGAMWKVGSDRIVAATYVCAVLATGGNATVKNCRLDELGAFSDVILRSAELRQVGGDVVVNSLGKTKGFGYVETGPHPMFPTDCQSLLLSLASVTCGDTVICEKVFENRLKNNADELTKMGAKIRLQGNVAHVSGTKLFGETTTANDLRGGAGLVIAGLAAGGKTVVKNVEHVMRGYPDLHEKLSQLGAKIILVN